MKNLINVVHPHTLKMIKKGDDFEFEVGPSSDINKPRDEKVMNFLNESQENSKILVHMEYSGNSFDRTLRKIAFESDPIYREFAKKLEMKKDCFYTLSSGSPIPNKMPKGIQKETWNSLRRNVISSYKLQKKSEGFSKVFFIGGFLERCLGNYIYYFSRNYANNGEKLFCVEDLCATFDEKEVGKIKDILVQGGIEFIKYKESVDLLNS